MRNIGILAYDMSAAAAEYPNDDISNALARTAEKLENLGKPFAPELTKIDFDVIAFFNGIKNDK